MRRIGFLAMLTIAALAAGTSARADDPLAIGVIGPFTGGSAPMGISMLGGVRLAVDEINRSGGVLGRPIALVERDDMANNERGARIGEELTSSHRVVAAVGLINTGVTLAAAPYFEGARIPLIVNVATGSLITKLFAPPEYRENYIFRMSTSTTVEVAMITAEVIRRGLDKVAILADSTQYGQVGRTDLVAALAKRHVTPVSIEKFNIGDTSMKDQLRRARAAGAQVLLTYGIGPELAHIALDRTALGWNVPIIGAWTLSMSNFIDLAGPSAEGASMPQTFIQEPSTPRRAAFIATYQRTYGVDRIPSPPSAAQGYDSVYVLAAAITQAGSADGPAIRAALDDLAKPVPGLIKTYDHPFSPANHEAIKIGDVVFGVVKNGRVVALSRTAP
jgi:branched-chain amino acid transport system substrate-binding protein